MLQALYDTLHLPFLHYHHSHYSVGVIIIILTISFELLLPFWFYYVLQPPFHHRYYYFLIITIHNNHNTIISPSLSLPSTTIITLHQNMMDTMHGDPFFCTPWYKIPTHSHTNQMFSSFTFLSFSVLIAVQAPEVIFSYFFILLFSH